ncbi:EAL domain-containing protein [Bacillus sp. FJAT-49736]|uniref:bifunctional diguanylate cyclase/phosphodiesterase n=1 Tax=Bacillus sp. FJAT-49736 TaxID=2833582 RepID=UPI001BC94A2C|nr:EAL domain-containing protein [Bacillus sp. FJAT-49736]MBS4172017.1 EAL domain-containing protein [Bacillus sp. FJAT-49736]
MVKSFQTLFQDESQLKRFVEEKELFQYPVISIHVSVINMELKEIEKLLKLLKNQLPQAVITGNSSTAKMTKGYITSCLPVITFTTFEKTNVRSGSIEIGREVDLVNIGQRIAKENTTLETKLVILFSNLKLGELDKILDGFYSINSDVTVIGGNSSEHKLSFVFTENGILESGIVFLSIENQDLIVETIENGEWQEIGLPFTITKGRENIIHEISGRKPLNVLKQYLGNNFVQRLPHSSCEIPFLIECNGEKQVAFIRNILEGGLLEVSTNIKNGDIISFAYENTEELISQTQKSLKRLRKKPVQTILAFHSANRIRNLEQLTQNHIKSLESYASVTECYCFGDIGQRTKNQPKLSAPASIYLTISESSEQNKNDISIPFTVPSETNSIITLTNLIKETAKQVDAIKEGTKVSEAYHQTLYENNMDIVYTLDIKGNFTSVNTAFEKAIGYSFNEIKGKSSLRLVVDSDVQKAQRHFRRSLNGKIQYYNVNIKTKNGDVESFHIKNIPVMVDNKCVGICGIGRDISENIKFEQKITQLANYDESTGLPNRTKFNEILDEMLNRAKKKRRSLAVLLLDIDRFKIINDTLGHYAGDLTLKELANRLKSSLSNGAYIGRFTNDKFSILLTKETNPESVIQIAKQLLKKIEMPFSYQKKEFFLSASVGISMYPYDGDQSEELLKNADIALGRAKSLGGNSLVFFSDDMNVETLNRVELESDLRKAIKNNELFLTYQPIIESSSQKMKSCEALIRWKHPERGIVPPLEFIPLAEETGLIHSIGKWVLKTACKQMKHWHDVGLTDASISINVSAYQFQNRWFIEDVKNALAYSDLDPKYLHLELTESVMVNDSIKTIDTMNALRNIGVKISIDDFGTGYSSLSYLRHLPIHILKIDKSFIQNLDIQTPDYAIVNSIMTMGHGLGLQVIAEGVETDMQFEILKNMKCHYIQGYLIEKPMQSSQMEEWLQDNNFICS